MPSTGSIVVTRDRAPWRDRARKYKVLIDHSVVGRLAQGETLAYALQPGKHSVQIKIDWLSSPKIDCSVEVDQAVHLVCGPGGPAFSGKAVLSLVRPGRYVRLEIRAET
jgi:hypothetical protein